MKNKLGIGKHNNHKMVSVIFSCTLYTLYILNSFSSKASVQNILIPGKIEDEIENESIEENDEVDVEELVEEGIVNEDNIQQDQEQEKEDCRNEEIHGVN